MKSEIKSAIIMGIIVVGIMAGLGFYFTTLEQPSNTQQTSIDKSGFKKAPELQGIAGYINTNEDELKEKIKGKVVLYDIWTYSCINCQRTLPYITAWDEKYSDKGLVIIGIHSPEFEFEKDINNVKLATQKFGINYPVVLDNDMAIWRSFDNHYWPRKYLADDEGYIRYDHIGEGNYDETEKKIQELLQERSQKLGLQVALAQPLVNIKEEHPESNTPELYFGYNYASGRNQFGNPEGFNPDNDVKYVIPQNLHQNNFYLDGTWKNLPDKMELRSDTGRIILPYSAKQVNIVAAGESTLTIYLDGKLLDKSKYGSDVTPDGTVSISNSRLYNIIKSENLENQVLEIQATSGLEMYTFTFG
ncbi:MAG: redoxin family protein [Candidatus Nitrosotenuis sp.]